MATATSLAIVTATAKGDTQPAPPGAFRPEHLALFGATRGQRGSEAGQRACIDASDLLLGIWGRIATRSLFKNQEPIVALVGYHCQNSY